MGERRLVDSGGGGGDVALLVKSRLDENNRPFKEMALRQKFNKLLVAAVIFVACPGDDIMALAPSFVDGNISVNMVIEADTVLEMFWTDKSTKEREEIEKDEAIKNG